MPVRRCAILLATAAAAAIAGGAAVSAGRSGAEQRASPTRFVGAQQASPATFVAVTPVGLGSRVDVRSATTGAVTRRLATFGQSFTNNGLAVSPDGREVYVTLIPRRHTRPFALRLIRIDVATRRQTFVGPGWQPSVSPDGGRLAYGRAPHGLAVRDLASGATRTLGLVRQLGPAADLLDADIVWLADGTDLAVVPEPPAWDLVGPRPPATVGGCHVGGKHPIVVFVHVPPPPQRLSAHCVTAPGATPPAAIAGDASAPTSLLLANGLGRRAFLERIAPSGATARLLTFGDALPLALDRGGTHLLYLRGHSPPALWEATIAAGRLVDRRRLLPDSRLGPAAY